MEAPLSLLRLLGLVQRLLLLQAPTSTFVARGSLLLRLIAG